jgi:tetratricopeptide (TPR) repeat protein
MSKKKNTEREDSHRLASLSRQDHLIAVVLTTFTLVFYALTAAPGVTMEDSGDFINGVLTLGIVHPPGYPLYVMLGNLFSFLPLGDPALRVNVFSSLWGALCLGVMFLNMRMLTISPLTGVFASLTLGFTTVYWSKSTVAEVYTFAGFLLAIIVFFILSYNRDKNKWYFYLACLTTGLSLSNHYPLTILSGLGLIFLLERKDLTLYDFTKGFLLLLLGLVPYVYLFIQATNPDLPYNFGRLSNAGMVFDHIRRKYTFDGPGGTAWDKVGIGLWYLKVTSGNFLLAGLILVSGIICAFWDRWKYRYPFLIAALCPSLGLILILAVPNTALYRSYFLDYSLPAFLFFSFFLALGLDKLFASYLKPRGWQWLLILVLLTSQVGFNFRFSSHHNDDLVHIWGTELFNSLPQDSILILCAPGNFALHNLQLTRGVGSRVAIYDRFSAYTKDNLYEPVLLFTRHDADEFRKKHERRLIKNSTRPIYYTCKDAIDELGVPFSYTPYVFRADRNHAEAADPTRFPASDRLLNALLKAYPKSEYWLDRLRRMIFSRLIAYYGGHDRPEAKKVVDTFKETRFYSQTPFVLSLANNLYFFKNYELAKSFYERADQLSLDAFSPTDLAVYCNLLANSKDFDKALGICTRQEQRSRPCDNNTVTTRQTIASIYRAKGQWSRVAQYSKKILECQPNHPAAKNYLQAALQKTERGQSATELIANDETK